MAPDPASNLRSLGYDLPEVPRPAGSYVPAVSTGPLVFTAGQLPLRDGSLAYRGKVGDELGVEEAQEAARLCALNALAAAAAAIGGLEGISQIIKVTGYIASAEGFTRQPEVLNGASDLLGDVFGAAGVHARSAVGVAELPLNAPVEVEIIASHTARQG
ncbi:MAG: RidA family protein [Rubrobacteraceae bacterium]